ncbi:MAG TPA: Flp family type IVb pilin [Dehalococcoidia bacterium]
MIALVNNTLLRLMAAVQARKMQVEEEGQTLVEYALIIALVSIGLILALTALRDDIAAVFDEIGAALGGAGSSS